MSDAKPTTRILIHGIPMVSAELYEIEREKVRVLREALEEITEANEQSPVKTYQRMEQIAHQALRATATEQEGE